MKWIAWFIRFAAKHRRLGRTLRKRFERQRMSTYSFIGCMFLLLIATVGGTQEAVGPSQLPAGNNTIVGPILLQGAPASKTIVFTNFSGENQHYGITISNHGNIGATVKDSGQFGGTNFMATINPGASYGAHVSVNNLSSIEIVFEKSADKSAVGKLTWRLDIVPRKR